MNIKNNLVIYSEIWKTFGCGSQNNLCKVKMAVVLVKNSGWSLRMDPSHKSCAACLKTFPLQQGRCNAPEKPALRTCFLGPDSQPFAHKLNLFSCIINLLLCYFSSYSEFTYVLFSEIIKLKGAFKRIDYISFNFALFYPNVGEFLRIKIY